MVICSRCCIIGSRGHGVWFGHWRHSSFRGHYTQTRCTDPKCSNDAIRMLHSTTEGDQIAFGIGMAAWGTSVTTMQHSCIPGAEQTQPVGCAGAQCQHASKD